MKYRVNLVQTVGHSVDVVANDPVEAEDIALGIGSGSLCHQCANITDLDSHGWDVGEVTPIAEES